MIIWDAAVRKLRALAGRRHGGRADPFGHIDFAIVDLETTGWSPDEASITEIGAVLVRGGRVQAQFSSLVNPGSAIPEQVTALTGISDAMVTAAPPLTRVLRTFLAFADGCVLTAHNAAFDLGFLVAACQACDLPWPGFQVLDTVELARLVLAEDEVPDCKLATLASFFGARTLPRHRALPDALATADVLAGLLRRLAASGARTLAEAGVITPTEAEITAPIEAGVTPSAGHRAGAPTGAGMSRSALADAGTLTGAGCEYATADGHERAGRQTWSPRSS